MIYFRRKQGDLGSSEKDMIILHKSEQLFDLIYRIDRINCKLSTFLLKHRKGKALHLCMLQFFISFSSIFNSWLGLGKCHG